MFGHFENYPWPVDSRTENTSVTASVKVGSINSIDGWMDGLIAGLIDCLLDWLLAWLIAWLIGWLIDGWIDWLVACLLACLLDWLGRDTGIPQAVINYYHNWYHQWRVTWPQKQSSFHITWVWIALFSPSNMCTFKRGTGWWYTYPSEKYESVSWDDEIPKK